MLSYALQMFFLLNARNLCKSVIVITYYFYFQHKKFNISKKYFYTSRKCNLTL